MKIAVTATGPTLTADMDTRFGRCPYFLLVDTDSLEFEAVDNNNNAQGSGAGIQSAQMLAQRQVTTVLTGNCGPNAIQTLSAAGINVFLGQSGTISAVVERFKAGELKPTSVANVESHAGKTSTDSHNHAR
jgi:predicted Fe-Mo cluster-binding NifX family protein